MMNVIISNPKEFEEKKRAFIDGGKGKVHVLSDFDRTLTRAFYHGHKASSIISKLRGGKYLVKGYAEKAQALFDRYHPIEIDPKISIEDKSETMYEWWRAHKQLLIDSGFDKQTIKQCIVDTIDEDTLVFREGVKEFFGYLKNNRIPLVIMSSSLEDLIDEFMTQKGVYSDNVHVIANSFEYENGKAVRYKRIIHVFNKHEMEIKGLPVYDKLLERKNVLLLGDSLGDLGMIEGFPYDNLIKIGFLNQDVDENLEKYKKVYDVLVLNDGDFSFVNELLEEIK